MKDLSHKLDRRLTANAGVARRGVSHRRRAEMKGVAFYACAVAVASDEDGAMLMPPRAETRAQDTPEREQREVHPRAHNYRTVHQIRLRANAPTCSILSALRAPHAPTCTMYCRFCCKCTAHLYTFTVHFDVFTRERSAEPTPAAGPLAHHFTRGAARLGRGNPRTSRMDCECAPTSRKCK